MLPSDSMRRQVFLLSIAQALFQTVSLIVMIVGGLAGALVSPDPALAACAIAIGLHQWRARRLAAANSVSST